MHAPGEILNSQLQVNCTIRSINRNDAGVVNTSQYTFYIVVVSEGIWTIENLNSIPQIGQSGQSHSKRMASLGIEAKNSNCGNTLKLSLLNHSSNIMAAAVNNCGYSKKMKDTWAIRSQASLWEEGSTTKWILAASAA